MLCFIFFPPKVAFDEDINVTEQVNIFLDLAVVVNENIGVNDQINSNLILRQVVNEDIGVTDDPRNFIKSNLLRLAARLPLKRSTATVSTQSKEND